MPRPARRLGGQIDQAKADLLPGRRGSNGLNYESEPDCPVNQMAPNAVTRKPWQPGYRGTPTAEHSEIDARWVGQREVGGDDRCPRARASTFSSYPC